MNLDDEIASFLASADCRPATSKLEPYIEMIRTLRQRRWAYKEIATALRDRFGLSVAPSSIHNFLKVRAHKKSVVPPIAASTLSPSSKASQLPRFNVDA
jgi:hypothetical protein